VAVEPAPGLVERYRTHLDALKPRGRLTRFIPGGVWEQVTRGMAVEFARVDLRAEDLLRESNPGRTNELLPDWERVLGLPDPCSGDVLGLAARRAAVIARLTAKGGASRAYFIAVANALGYAPVEIEEHQLFRVGIGAMGDPISNEEWAFHWTVHAPVFTLFFFESGGSGSGEALNVADNSLLECAIERIKPAHTVVHFEYDLPYEGPTPWGPTIAPSPARLLLRTVPPGVTNA
jgi:uncharacterized protein YmfQ (DUF2313 family)